MEIMEMGCIMMVEGKHVKKISTDNIKRIQLCSNVCINGHRDQTATWKW
jgi:hypothetical protein